MPSVIDWASRFSAFVAERHPLALAEALDALAAVTAGGMPGTDAGLDALREPFRRAFIRRELVSMRMCGHAHHDDMLYLGREPRPSWGYPPLGADAYADRERYRFWSTRDPIVCYAARLVAAGVIAEDDTDRLTREAEAMVEEQAQAVIDAPWPDPAEAGADVVADEPPRRHIEVLDPEVRLRRGRLKPSLDDGRDGPEPAEGPAAAYEGGELPPVEPGPPHNPAGQTFIEASVLDLRSLAPLDRGMLLAVARHCHKVLIVHEDSVTGGIGQSLAAIIQEEAFEWLDAPVRVMGALDTPVPYAPPLEAFFLPGEALIARAARLLVAY